MDADFGERHTQRHTETHRDTERDTERERISLDHALAELLPLTPSIELEGEEGLPLEAMLIGLCTFSALNMLRIEGCQTLEGGGRWGAGGSGSLTSSRASPRCFQQSIRYLCTRVIHSSRARECIARAWLHERSLPASSAPSSMRAGCYSRSLSRLSLRDGHSARKCTVVSLSPHIGHGVTLRVPFSNVFPRPSVSVRRRNLIRAPYSPV